MDEPPMNTPQYAALSSIESYVSTVEPQHCNDLAILDRHGEIAAVIRYSPDMPMGGARVWIEAIAVQVLDEGGAE